MSDIIVVDRLEKRYGSRLAVRGVSFSIEEGEIIGLLGPNGSGKSTILRILTGFLPPSAGSARIDGFDVAENSLAVRKRVGYVPEDAPLYEGMRVSEFLRFMAAIKGVSASSTRAVVGAACERLDLGRVFGMTIGKLSRGYRQRVAIAQALLNDPAVLILDEPTNALDAYQVIGVRELLRTLAGERTVLVASHVLSEIDKVASRIMILLDGKLLTADAVRDGVASRRFRLRIAGFMPAVLAALEQVAGVTAAAPDAPPTPTAEAGDGSAYVVEVAPGAEIAARLAQAVTARGFALSELIEVKPDVETVFLELTRRAALAEETKAKAA